MPSSESAFLEGVAENSIALSSALEQLDVEVDSDSVMTSRPQALVLEKLAGRAELEEDLPDGL